MLKPAKNQGISYYRGVMLLVLAMALFVVSAPNQSYAMSQQRTVATFADPSPGGDEPLFIIDFGDPAGTLTSCWGDDRPGRGRRHHR